MSDIEGEEHNEEEESLILYICMENDSDSVSWYQIDPHTYSFGDDAATCVSRMPTIRECGFPMRYASVVLGTKIYIIGGIESTICDFTSSLVMQPLHFVPSSKVFVYDIRFPECGWNLGVPMIGGKAYPIVAAVDGNIFVFGSNHSFFYTVFGSSSPTTSVFTVPAEPWAEVFDPLSLTWSTLPYPPNSVFDSITTGMAKSVFNYSMKSFLLSCPGVGLTTFDVKDYSWTCHHDTLQKHRSVYERFDSSSTVIVGAVVYMFCDKRLYACPVAAFMSLDSCSGATREVHGLGSKTESIDDDFTKVFLLHLGKKELCLVWSVQGFPKMKRVCCLAFCVSTEEGGKLQAKEQKFSSYLAKGKALVDCLAIKWASCNNVEPVGTSTISSFAVPGTRQNMVPSPQFHFAFSETSQVMIPSQLKQVTRHARRVYVGDLPTGADRQKIVSFFCGVISDIGAVTNPDLAVVDIHINGEKNFAILEMISVALASNMMALDGIIFKGAPLRIRRPGDYNPGLAANLGPTQPSCYLKLEIITRKKFAANDQDTMLRRTMQALAWEASIPYSNGLDAGPSRVICLLEAVCASALLCDEYYQHVKKFFQEKGEKYGTLFVYIPRPMGKNISAVGRVFLEYSSIEDSAKAMEGVIRKDFGYYKVILACYYPEDKYDEKDLNFLDEYINLKCT